jgi:hypothetical protein
MADVLSEAQQKLMAFVNDPAAARALGSTLAEIAVELMDAKLEAKHWKKSFETVKDELKVLASVSVKRKGRLVITRKELQAVEGQELFVDTPEPGVRIYELRERQSKVGEAVGRAIATTPAEASAISSGAIALANPSRRKN